MSEEVIIERKLRKLYFGIIVLFPGTIRWKKPGREMVSRLIACLILIAFTTAYANLHLTPPVFPQGEILFVSAAFMLSILLINRALSPKIRGAPIKFMVRKPQPGSRRN